MATVKKWEVVDEQGETFQREDSGQFGSVQNLRWLAHTLDSQFNVLGVRVGWDAILGLIPGIGDLATNIAAFYIVIQASNLGAPASVILRMGLNLIIDNLVEAVPFLGHFFDAFWRANIMNVDLLERYLENPRKTTVSSRWVVVLTLTGVLLVSMACIAIAAYFTFFALHWIVSSMQVW
ncbi:MAG: DUF4112 domain-containing protein [Bdellovibrionota bacterium]